MKHNYLILVIVFQLVATCYTLGQVVDDTTQLVYGPHSTKYFLEEEIKYNQFNVNEIDTSLYDMENFGLLDYSHRVYQDLGANGTALYPIWFDSPEVIGLRSGYNSYDPFFKEPSQFKYFDTKSPFMDLGVAFGGQGRSSVNFEFSRNIKPKWNFGVDIRRIESDKQIGPSQSQGDKNAISTSVDLYTYYRSENNKYLILGYAQRFSHQVEETGGVFTGEDEPTEAQLFQYTDSPIQLTGAQNEDLRSNIHVYQEYRIGKILQLYHQADFRSQKNLYKDQNDPANVPYVEYYPNVFLSSSGTSEANLFRTISNEVGIKGDIQKGFYSAYVKQRNVFNEFRFIDEDIRENELYVGGTLRYDINDKNKFGGEAEFLQTGDFRFDGAVINKFFEAGYEITQFQPSILQERYFGNHYYWDNSFQSTLTNAINGKLKLNLKMIDLEPFVKFRTLDNYIYFDESSLPQQFNGSIITGEYGVDFRLKLPTSKTFEDAIIFDNEFKYTSIDGDDEGALRIPELYYYGKLFWQGYIFKRSMWVNIGFNINYRDSYFGMDYNPVVQQFFLQDEREFKEYVVVDAFLNFKVKTMRIFFKVNHINQRNNNGYFITPFYPGQANVIDLGVRWQFFD